MKPGDQRGFLHKKILGVIGDIGSAIPVVGGTVSAAARLLGGGRGGRTTLPRTLTARPTVFSEAGKELGKRAKFGGEENGNGCIWPTRRDPRTGSCRIFAGEESGPDGGAPVGDAVMGRYGAALEPGIMNINRSVCPRGAQLGDDGLCYNKSQITNKQRMWPAGRRPLLSGGEMRAISIAATAGRRLERTTKRLQRIGLMKKPNGPRRLPPGRKPTVIKEAGAGSVTVQ